MASGKKNYFRHDFKAHESPDIQLIVEKFGVHGYYFYFVLAERCAELISDGHEFPLTFYEGSLRKSLKVSKKNLRSFLEFSEEFLGISSETSGKLLRISWPKLLKYIGSYSKKTPNKIKEKEIKGNKIKLNEIKKESDKSDSAPLESVPKNEAKKNIQKNVDKKNSDGNLKAQAFIKTYCELFKQRWKVNPVIRGKQSGLAKHLSAEMSLERFEFLLKAFFAMPDAWNVKNKHPLELFVSKLNEIVVYAELGDFQTQAKSKQNDQAESVKDQLRRIDRGEL